MKTSAIAQFYTNRERFPLDELCKYEGQWVAFRDDGTEIVAGAASIASLADELQSAGIDLGDVMIEHIVFGSTEIYSGAAELS